MRYQNDWEGWVDDITLDELIEAKRIGYFYRPSEDKWVDISTDPVRGRGGTNTTRSRRRASDREGKEEREEKTTRFSSRLSGPGKHASHLSAKEWFERGFVAFHTTEDCEGAARSFAHSIRLDPTDERAYVNRGLVYERMGNVQQAVEDYSRAAFVNPDDSKVYYRRGLALRRLGMDADAIKDLKKAAELGSRPAYDFLRSISVPS